jgi:DNA (cytosine-5)-methyltransferase 1|tara:strand:+ start:3789 stop:4415 length:627 start_codon:yes stop_codon:yes gene_type:complete
MKILNLYAGIGGNRKLWEGHEVTAVENDVAIAKIYKDFFPQDTLVIGDAHQYLLDHYKEFDFIWSSPPCPTHSDIRRCGVHAGQYEAKYPDMRLYEEIILLNNFAPKDCKWVVENVKPYYKPLIEAKEIERHLFWTNFDITHIKIPDKRVHNDIVGSKEVYGYKLDKYSGVDKRKVLRNMVNPELGLHILNEAMGVKDKPITEQLNLL